MGLANATRLIAAEHPGQGDSVEELDGIWEDMSVFQIYEAILAEKSPDSVVPDMTGRWGDVRAGANALIIPLDSLVAPPRPATCNVHP
jgi:hypothetical protein